MKKYNWIFCVFYVFCPCPNTVFPQLKSNTCLFSSVQSFSRVWLFATPWIAARQASLSITNSRSSLKLMSIESVMPSSHLILCRPLLLLPPILPSIRVFSNESTLGMRWPKLKDTRRHAPFLHGGTLYLLDYRCFLPSFKTSLPPLLLQHISEYCIPSLWKLQPPRVLLLLEYKATRPEEKS